MIKIIQESDVEVTEGDLLRYLEAYRRSMAYHIGPRPSLEEYIRSMQMQQAVDNKMLPWEPNQPPDKP